MNTSKTYICDECKKETTLYARLSDGRCLCKTCIKLALKKPSNKKPSKDPFIRKARSLYNKELGSYRQAILISDIGKCYTNGAVLLSQIKSLPDKYDTIDVDTLESIEILYPDISKVIPTSDPDYIIEIPKDFYKLITPFSTRKGKITSTALIGNNGIQVNNDNEGRVLNYREIDTSTIYIPIKINLLHLKVFKPKNIYIYKGITNYPTLYVKSSHDKYIDTLIVLVKGIDIDS